LCGGMEARGVGWGVRRAALAVRGGCRVNVAVAFVFAGAAGVARILEVAVSPAVGADGTVWIGGGRLAAPRGG
jgi:hypothetical protein